MEFIPNKKAFLDSMGRPITQSLFLEVSYDPEVAVYTLKEYDHEYEGKLFPSIKRLYIQMEDVIEYDFANKYFLGWQHWLRISNNKLFKKHVEEWRAELELKIRSQAVQDIIDMSAEERSFQAAKWLADKGWAEKRAGRPTKEQIEREREVQDTLNDKYGADVVRLKL